jgi:hypothetical protein
VSKGTVTEIGAVWTAIVGDTPHEYKTRHGAIHRIVDEIEHWIKWARSYDHAALDELIELKGQILAATGDADWNFTIAGLPAHAGLRKP